MPGFSMECSVGAHDACQDPNCRCLHHTKVQEMIRQSDAKELSEKQIQRPPEIAVQELTNACPSCQKKYPHNEVYCRRDGTKLIRGNQCLRCETVGQTEDVHCYICGTKFGEKPEPPPQPEVAVSLPSKEIVIG
jgi:hypothetical protein